MIPGSYEETCATSSTCKKTDNSKYMTVIDQRPMSSSQLKPYKPT